MCLTYVSDRSKNAVSELQERISKLPNKPTTTAYQINLSTLTGAQELISHLKTSTAGELTIDILVNNAGLMATAWETSPDGYEIDLATNHLGPFLFTNLIMNKIIASPAPRVITVSSSLHRLGPFRFDDYNFHVCAQHFLSSVNGIN